MLGVDISGLPLWQRQNWSIELSTAPRLLADLAEDEDVSVRVGVARNVWTPADVLIRLATDRSDEVRAGVAGNPKTPIEALGRLVGDTSPGVRSEARDNPAAATNLWSG